MSMVLGDDGRIGMLALVTTRESGIDLGDFGFPINSIEIECLKALFSSLSTLNRNDYARRSLGAYEASHAFTQGGFTKSFERAVLGALQNTGRLDR